MTPAPDDDDEIDMDEWMAKSDADIDRELDVAFRQHDEWWNNLSTAEQIAHSRRWAIELCLSQRKLIRENGHWDFMRDFMRENLKRTQVRLLKIREWRRTGQYPGTA